MASYLHPGVYIQEVPGSRSIEGVSTDVAVFIGVAEDGPYNTPTLVTSWPDFNRTFGDWIFHRYLPFAVYSYFSEGGSRCYVVRAKPAVPAQAANVSLTPVTVNATSEGQWAQDLQIQIADYPVAGTGGAPTPVFALSVLIPLTGLTPTSGLSFAEKMILQFVQDNSSPVVTVNGTAYYQLEQFAGFSASDVYNDGSATLCPFVTRINGSSLFIRVQVAAATPPTRPANAVAPFQNAVGATFDFPTAIASLNDLQGFSIVALPDSVSYTTSPQGLEQPIEQRVVVQALLTSVEALGTAFVVADPPYGLDVTGILDFKQGTGSYPGNALNSEYGALYYPWLRFLDLTSGTAFLIPPSGAVTGRYSHTDQKVGVWKAAAGVSEGKLHIATALERKISEVQQDSLNPAGIDAICTLLLYGICIWGARTLSLDPEWRYVPVRRLVIFIEQSIYEAIQWVVFEPNTTKLWGSVVRDITAFLTNVWLDGALFGVTAAEAFYVTCDASNNPPETRDLGYLFIDVGIAPVKPAEFVIVRIVQTTAGAAGS